MIDENAWNRLARYVAGEYSADEAEELRRWVESDPERREALAFMRDVNARAEASRPQWDTAESWNRLAARKSARARRPLLLPYVQSESRRLVWRPAVRVAAALLIAASGSLLWMWQSRRSHEPGSGAPAAVAMQELLTPRGRRANLRLPDGSQVILGVASRLRYPASFGSGGRRDVYLEGQAFFEVEHDERRPFVVHTAKAVTEDLGTKFAVHEYSGDSIVRVVVTEGSVELRAQRLPPGRRGALLQAGQLGQLGSTGDALVRSDVDVTRYLAWTRGQLVVEDTPLRDALPQLSRWYDLDFELGDSALGARRLTASFDAEAIGETLQLLASTLDIRYERHGRTVRFLPKPRTHR